MTIFGLTMMAKSFLEIFILKSLNEGNYFPLPHIGEDFPPKLQIHEQKQPSSEIEGFEEKNEDLLSPSFLGQKL